MPGKIAPLVSIICMASSLAFCQTVSTVKGRSGLNVLELSSQVDDTVNLIEGNVVLVHSGDSISVVAKDGSMYLIRLQGVDAPENKQAFGQESAKQLAALIQGMDVVVIIRKMDLRDGYLGAVFLDGDDISLMQIRRGMAWNYVQYGLDQTEEQRAAYAQAEQRAHADHVGLWADSNPISPWEFRGEQATQVSKVQISVKAAEQKPTNAAGSSLPSLGAVAADKSTANPSTTSKKYILGPRGGCYYLNDSGVKVYVKNKSLCGKQ